jgi:hypothetical protein
MSKVWVNADGIYDPIIVIGKDAIITASLKDDELQDAKSRIEQGESPLNLFGDKATMIPYFSIQKIKLEENDEDIEIGYKGEKDTKSKTLGPADKAAQQEILAEIQSHLGDGFTSMTEKYSLPRAAFPSLMTLSVFIIITNMLYGAAAEIATGVEMEITGRRRGLKKLFVWILDLIGPTGVLIIGGNFMLFAILALVKRIKEPTVVTTIKQGEQRPGSPIVTIIKYVIFVGVWALFGPWIVSSLFS